MRLHHSPDASTFPGFELMCFVYIACFSERITALGFDLNMRSHLALCLCVMLPHYRAKKFYKMLNSAEEMMSQMQAQMQAQMAEMQKSMQVNC